MNALIAVRHSPKTTTHVNTFHVHLLTSAVRVVRKFYSNCDSVHNSNTNLSLISYSLLYYNANYNDIDKLLPGSVQFGSIGWIMTCSETLRKGTHVVHGEL
jgi:hypothetical protein